MENQNPTGTHKDRSMKPWAEKYANLGVKELTISSSGNSAISAAKFCGERGIKLNVFVSPHIDGEKLARIKKCPNTALHTTRTPNRDAFRFSKERGVPNLRASKDDAALEGYKEIAYELMEQLPRIDNLFIPTSSGATLEGIYLGYKAQSTKHKAQIPSFFAVQTTKVHPIASYFDTNFVSEKTSHATAIVDNVAHRRDSVIKIIQETGGGGFVISNRELEGARALLMTAGPAKLGWHSALAFAGFLKWKRINPKSAGGQISVCLFTDYP